MDGEAGLIGRRLDGLDGGDRLAAAHQARKIAFRISRIIQTGGRPHEAGSGIGGPVTARSASVRSIRSAGPRGYDDAGGRNPYGRSRSGFSSPPGIIAFPTIQTRIERIESKSSFLEQRQLVGMRRAPIKGYGFDNTQPRPARQIYDDFR